MSSTYYALFHCLAREGADLIIGGRNSKRSEKAWLQVYRALDHGTVKRRYNNKNVMGRFPKEIDDFANAFVTMQEKRHAADYDPAASFAKSTVRADVLLARRAIASFKSAAEKDRRAFCVFVLLRER